MIKTIKAAVVALLLIPALLSCTKDQPVQPAHTLNCQQPAFLKAGDKVALISPSYFTPMENVTKTADVLRGWGFEPVIGPNVGKIEAGKYAGTVQERISDILWAFRDPEIKAIICNRGGYGTIQLVDQISLTEFSRNPKWLVGFSDITTLHEMLSCAGVMSIQGTMSSFLAAGGTDISSTLVRDLLKGQVPRYELPAHPQNITGSASGTMDVRQDGDTLSFNIDGTQTPVSTGSAVTKSTPTSLQRRLFLSGKALAE